MSPRHQPPRRRRQETELERLAREYGIKSPAPSQPPPTPSASDDLQSLAAEYGIESEPTPTVHLPPTTVLAPRERKTGFRGLRDDEPTSEPTADAPPLMPGLRPVGTPTAGQRDRGAGPRADLPMVSDGRGQGPGQGPPTPSQLRGRDKIEAEVLGNMESRARFMDERGIRTPPDDPRHTPEMRATLSDAAKHHRAATRSALSFFEETKDAQDGRTLDAAMNRYEQAMPMTREMIVDLMERPEFADHPAQRFRQDRQAASTAIAKAVGTHGDFVSGAISGGLGQNPTDLGHFLRSIGQEEAGQALIKYGKGALEGYKPRVGRLKDIESAQDAIDYLQYTLGSGLGSMAPSAVGGLIGGGIGTAVSPGVGTTVGTFAGAGAPALIQNVGQVYGELEELGVEDADKRRNIAFALGIPITALDVVTPGDIITKLLKGLTASGVAKKTLKEKATDVAKGAVRSGLTEAGTEGLQEAIQYTGTRATTDAPFRLGELGERSLEGMVGGLVTGAAAGAGGRVASYGPDAARGGAEIAKGALQRLAEAYGVEESTPATAPSPATEAQKHLARLAELEREELGGPPATVAPDPGILEGGVEGFREREAARPTADEIALRQGLDISKGRGARTVEVDTPAGAARISRVPVSELSVDPGRFQYKRGLDPETGTGSELKPLGKYDEMLGGVLAVWTDPSDGKTYVVNGHHRYELAKRSGHPSVNVLHIEAADANEARAQGAVLNLAEGRGSPLDGAKFLRATGYDIDRLRERVSLKGAVANRAVGLSKLAPDVFDAVERGEIAEAQGAAIGHVLPDSPEMQRAAAQILKSDRFSEAEAVQIARQVEAAGSEKVAQDDLFGTGESSIALAGPRAKLIEAIGRKLGSERNLFAFVAREGRAEALAQAGNVIDVERSGALAQQAGQIQELFERFANRAGPLSQILTEGARRIVRGEKAQTVSADIYQSARDALSTALAGGTGPGDADIGAEHPPQQPVAGRTEAEQPQAPQAQEVDPTQSGLFSPAALDRFGPAKPQSRADAEAGVDPIISEIADSLDLEDPDGGALFSPTKFQRKKAVDRLEVRAVRVSGEVYEGHDYHEAYVAAQKGGDALPGSDIEWGFVTSSGRFVRGFEAIGLAARSGQIKKGTRFARAIESGVFPLDEYRRARLSDHSVKGLNARPINKREVVLEGEINSLDSLPPTTSISDPRFRKLHEERLLADAARILGIRMEKVVMFPGREDPSVGEWFPIDEFTSGEWTWKDTGEPILGAVEGYLVTERPGTEGPSGEPTFMTRGEAEDRYADAMDFGPEGRDPDTGKAMFSPARRKGREQRDIFGTEPEAEATQESLFGERAGTEASRSLSETEAAARSELVVLRQRHKLEADPEAKASAAARIAELERLVNRGEKISASELARRAEGESETADDLLPPDGGMDTLTLFSPISVPPQMNETLAPRLTGQPAGKSLGAKLRRWLGIKRFDEEKVLSLYRIHDAMGKAFGVPVRKGRFSAAKRSAAGAFFPSTGVIRTIDMTALSTLSHEIAHHVSLFYLNNPTVSNRANLGPETFGRLTAAARDELEIAGRALYGTRKPSGPSRKTKENYQEEGIAEWGRAFVTAPSQLRAFPDFNKYMEIVFEHEPAMRDIMLWARERHTEYRTATPDQRVDAVISVGEVQQLSRSSGDIVTNLVDDLNPIAEIVDELGTPDDPAADPYVLARLSRGTADMLNDWLLRGVVDFDTGQRVTRGVAQIIEDVGAKNLQRLRRYMVAERTLELSQRGIVTPVKDSDAVDIVTKGRNDPALVKAANDLWEFRNAGLKWAMDAGAITKEAHDAMVNSTKFPTPLMRVIDPDDTGASFGTGKALAQRSAGKFRIKGSERDIVDPLESIAGELHRLVSRSQKVRVVQALARLARKHPQGGAILEFLPEKPKELVSIPLMKVVDQLAALGFTPPDINKLSPKQQQDLIEAALVMWQEKRAPGLAEAQDLVFQILIDGEKQWVTVRDRNLYETLLRMEPAELEGWAVRAAEVVAQSLRVGATDSPGFVLMNAIRDAWHTTILSKSERVIPTVPFADHLAGILHILRKDDVLRDYLNAGGGGAGLIGADRARAQTKLTELGASIAELKGARRQMAAASEKLLRFLQGVSAAVEKAPRIAEFQRIRKEGRKRGLSRKSADIAGALASRELIDFGRVGVQLRAWNRIAAFSNAHIQDLVKVGGELSFYKDPKRSAKVWSRAMLSITVPSITLYLLQRDDETYRAVPRWIKETSWVLVIPGTRRYIAIPRPFLLGYLFGRVPELLLEYLEDRDPEHLEEMAGSLGRNLVPPYIPNLAIPIIENFANRDLRTGAPIVPASTERLDPEMQVRPSTSGTSRALGDLLNYSPAKIENVIGDYTGELGRNLFLDVPDLLAGRPMDRPVPVVSRFLKGVTGTNAAQVEDVYQDFEDAERRRQTWRRLTTQDPQEAAKYLAEHRDEIASVATEEDMGQQGHLRSIRQQLLDLREQRKAIVAHPTMDEARKKDALKRNDDALIRVASQYQSRRADIRRRTLQDALLRGVGGSR